MKTNAFLKSSIGQKTIMATTGLFLITFLIVHCYVNANVLLANGEENFNRAANFMGTNLLIRISEVILFLGLLLHAYKGFALYFSNKSKRSIGYAVEPPSNTATWYSKSMTLLGTLILFFLVIHLAHFWVPSRFGHLEAVNYQNGLVQTHNLYLKMKEVFANPYTVGIYLLGCISLAWHLLHGFQSAFRTFGLTNHSSFKTIQTIGVVFSITIPFLFALMPIFLYFNIEINLNNIGLLF